MTPISEGNTRNQVYNRIIRSFSSGRKENGSEKSPFTPATTLVDDEANSSTEEGTLQRVASTSPTIGKQRFNVGDRVRKLGRNIKKIRRNSDKSALASPRITINDTPFPTTDPALISPVSSTLATTNNHEHVHERLLSIVSELQEAEDTEEIPSPTVVGEESGHPEAMSFAKRIQSLMGMLSFPGLGQPSPGPLENEDPEGRAIPPQDSRLIRFLSSPTVMNGSAVKDKPSIWSILERIGAPQHAQPPLNDHSTADEGESMLTDSSSVMVYSPLIPSIEDHVELAELVPVEAEEVQEVVQQKPDVITSTSWTSVWPLSSLWFTTTPTPAAQPQQSVETISISSSPRSTNLGLLPPENKAEAPRAWVPSTTKLSVQAMWWGYRLYLPPPILEILDDQTLEATKRAAMITTALAWFANNLPVSALPPALRPGVMLLQRLVPYLGYIGSFISWSWSTIKSYDIGYGVTLTATWLLPVALIPGTWHENDFPKSPGPQKTIPLPSLTYFAPSLPSYTVTSTPTPSNPLLLTSTSTSSSSPLSPSSLTTTTTRTPSHTESTSTYYAQTPLNYTPVPSNPWTMAPPPSSYVTTPTSIAVAGPSSPRSLSWNPWGSPRPHSRHSITPPTPAPLPASPAMTIKPLTNLTTPTMKLTNVPSSPTLHSHPSIPSTASTVFYTPQSVPISVSVPSTPYTHRNVSPLPLSHSTPISVNPNFVYMPVASPPPTDDDIIAPVPPVPNSPAVPLGSPLMEQLLHGPLMGVVPLPDEETDSIVPQAEAKKVRKAKRLFH